MSKALIRRPTAMTTALFAAAAAAGIDTSRARVPAKTEPSWTVTRRADHRRPNK
jgi:hypothetical protein